MTKKIERRGFLKTAGLGAAVSAGMSAKSYRNILGANERINVAMLGCYRRYSGVVNSVNEVDGMEMTYVCDVDSRRQSEGAKKAHKLSGIEPKQEKDLRKIYEDKDVDAVVVMLPDHWHAPAAWMAMEAGKQVYLEKPCMHNPAEGESLLAYQKKYGSVVQVGNQQRSSKETQQLMVEIRKGAIGDVHRAKAFYTNKRGRVPNPKQVPVPEYLDWDLWQGPAPRTEFMELWGDYNWHWDWRYGTAESGNNAMHELDVARWALGVDVPKRIRSVGTKSHFMDDGWSMYDTIDSTFIYEGDKTIQWDGKSRDGFPTYGAGRGTIIYGSTGSVWVDRNGFKMYDRAGKLMKEAKAGSIEAGTALGGGGDMTTLHMANFAQAIRGKEEINSPLHQGVKGTNLCLYTNISYRMGNSDLEVDTKTGRFKDKKAMKLWSRDYEKGWAPKL